ncbi:MAG TPA: glycosyltransferase family 2 protein [Sedimentisphaerales bacterium]|nr:glycosyltransferase family 2 protein [Sedimentisphaerales bacterium]
MSEYDIVVSIVTYKNDDDTFKKCIDTVLGTNLRTKLYVVDNWPTDKTRKICSEAKVEYIPNKANAGYGAAHNLAIARTLEHRIKYHLVLNPDVCFEKGTLERLYYFMEKNSDIGMVMPKILYPDGSLQYLCKLLPTPFDLIARRFLPYLKYLDRRKHVYELRFTGYNKTMDVPYLSGCFMFIRTDVLREVGLFDERFFMYMEDLDLSRRIHEHYRTVYYPHVSVFHQYEKGSYKNSKLLKYHLQSAVRYFNKWGYFFDKDRRDINQKTLKKLTAGGETTSGRETPA